MPTVYIVNDSGHNFDAAKKWGELEILNTGDVNKFKVSEMFRKLHRLGQSAPDDYILMSGPVTMMAVATGYFAAMHGKLNLLLYRDNGGQDSYVVRRLDFTRVLYEKAKEAALAEHSLEMTRLEQAQAKRR